MIIIQKARNCTNVRNSYLTMYDPLPSTVILILTKFAIIKMPQR